MSLLPRVAVQQGPGPACDKCDSGRAAAGAAAVTFVDKLIQVLIVELYFAPPGPAGGVRGGVVVGGGG